MDKNELVNLKENKHYWKVEKVAKQSDISLEKAQEFTNTYYLFENYKDGGEI